MSGLELLAMWSQIAGAALFVVLAVVIYNKYMAPGVASYTASKNREIQDEEARRERLRADLRAAQAELDRGEADAREIRARLQVIVNREREASLAAAKAEAQRIVRNAEGELERARLAARDRLRVEFIEKALAKARNDARTSVDAPTNARLVEATVAGLTRGKG